MRTTLNIDDALLKRAMEVTGIQEKTSLVQAALKALIASEQRTPFSRGFIRFENEVLNHDPAAGREMGRAMHSGRPQGTKRPPAATLGRVA
jgi:hypothetical protein